MNQYLLHPFSEFKLKFLLLFTFFVEPVDKIINPDRFKFSNKIFFIHKLSDRFHWTTIDNNNNNNLQSKNIRNSKKIKSVTECLFD